MATRQTVSGTGFPQNVVLEFPYINQSHVKVEVGGVPLAYTWVNPTTIGFTAGAGQQVAIYRDTPNDGPLVVFGTVNSVGADDLNLATKQALFVAQEFGDLADEAVANGLASKANLNHTHSTATSSTAGFMSATDKAKLDDLNEVVQDIVGSTLEAGPNVSVVYNDATGKITLSATGTLSADWNTLANRPISFTPSGHTHSYADVPGLTSDLTSLQTQINGKFDKSGGTLTGDATISKSNPALIFDKTAAGQFNRIRGRTNGVLRWDLVLGDDSAESGSNAGSAFSISRYSDTGVLLGSGMTIRRSDGYTTIPGNVEVCSPNANQSLYIRKQSDPSEGGQLTLEKPSASALSGLGVNIDLQANSLRIFEDGGTNRGLTYDITACAAGVGSVGTHSGNLGAQLAAITAGSLGSFGFMRDNTAGTAPNATVAGSNLFYAANGNPGIVAATGTWRCHGSTSAAGQVSLFQRIA